MPLGAFARIVRTAGLVVSLLACAAAIGEAAPAGTSITNAATMTYTDAQGETFTAQSNAVTVLLAAVSAIAVIPKETAADPAAEGYTAGTLLTRTFTITNGGNVADAYTIAVAATGAGTLASIAFVTSAGNVPITLNSTLSPLLQPGESIKVQLTVNTAGVAVGTTFPITLTARTTNIAAANGLVSDSGRQWAISLPGATIAGPLGPNTIVTKLVNQVRSHPAQPGETVTYAISFKNYGGSPATNVVLTDNVPAGIAALPQTVALNGTNIASAATLNGQVLTVKLGTLAVGATETLTFDANVLSGSVAGASFVNVATIQADGIAQSSTSPASIFIGLANVVYDGFAGSGAPVGGAVLTLRDFNTKTIVALPKTGTSASSSSARMPLEQLIGVPADGLAPNRANANPFITASDGTYSFVFAPNQLGTAAGPAVYELDASAPGYRDRHIQVTISPDASGLLYNAVLRELDDQMLATPGGFALVANSVSLPEVFGLLGNLPMFAAHPLAVTKTVDRDVASGGDRLLYTIQAGASGASLGATKVVDTLPAGVVYAPGTARVDNVPVEPARVGRTLTWAFPNLSNGHTITYACVVMPYAAEGATLVNVVDVDATTSSGTHVAGFASADTRVVSGPLGNRIVITGRVFVDVNGTGRYREGDRGVAAVRIYLEDGESVTTDKYGRFTFPSVHPGQHVLRVDESTLPPGVRPFGDRRYDSAKSMQRLVHGLFDAGLMQDVNFALQGAP
ncbi:MAG TPA: isopeptide-forming domain-containing fimbrial protein [Candidatus Elarobacter sp.]|jgi:uncharacterized repeat protein (TIGR01451 family)|nr:isopeptide-forming domain-containing fimbrial protein [Candidatus Elarobacter sp.]